MCRLLRGGAILLIGLLLCTGCSAKEEPKTAEAYLRQGNLQLSQKRQGQARQAYEKLLEEFPESEYKAQAQFNIAESLYREASYLEARFEYQKFLELYPSHPLASRAQFQLGMCSLQDVQSFDRDQQRTKEALQAFRLFRRQHPQDPLVAEAETHIQFLRQRLAEHEFAIARFYYRKGANQAAIGRFLNFIQIYPDMPNLDAAFYMLADSYRAEENYGKAHSVFQLLMDRFPNSTYLARTRTQLSTLPASGMVAQ